MKILVVITYYRPHTSGLTIYAERLAKAFVKAGHQVTILTSQFDQSTPRDEMDEGVRIIRVPVLFRVSKGVIMPSFGWVANRLVLEHDVIQLHLPQFDAAGISLRGRLLKKPTIVTYHCDLKMPPGFLNKAANLAVHFMNHLTARFTHRIVTYTKDYAENSPYLQKYIEKLRVIPPPVLLPETTPEKIKAFKTKTNPKGKSPVIAMVSRFATEKGVEVLLDALPMVLEKFPDTQVQFAGSYEHIIGEEHYFDKLIPKIREFEESGNWLFLGNLTPTELSAFYPNLDMITMPSLNSTEAFGLVQIEAMINGVPSIASNLPGVRQPVKMHGMGKIVEIGDPVGLARAIVDIASQPDLYQNDPYTIAEKYKPASIVTYYENLFSEMLEEIQ
ncbi:MAG: glycosyltransferase family 4 protein [Anaerolineaceae bacterium]|nr:glycosyltransferase family 4 protein [Anaerolineaceae bacterium]